MWNKKAEANRVALIKEACRNGDLRLQAQTLLAIAADQRASVLAGIYVAAGTAVIGAVCAALLADTEPGIKILIPGACATAILLFLGSLFCIWATMPVPFTLPGNEPRNWEEDIGTKKILVDAIWEQACLIDDGINENRKVMKDNVRKFQIGALLGVSAPVVGVVVAGLFCLFSSCFFK